MNKRNGSQFQPDHAGNHPLVINPGTPSHSSDRTHINEHNAAHGYDGGKAPKAKHGGANTPVHGGMHRVVDGKPTMGGGSHASYLDSIISGAVVPAARNTAQPGWGNASARSGNPMVHAPAGKVLSAPKVSFGTKSQSASGRDLSELGRAILDESFAASDADTRRAHGRGK